MIKAEILKRQVLLQDLDEAGLAKVANITRQVSIKKGEPLFKEKEDTQGLWLIHSGKVEISRVTADGWRQTLVVLPADIFSASCPFLRTENMWRLQQPLKTPSYFLYRKTSSRE